MAELEPIQISRIEVFVYRIPLEIFVKTSFGVMRDRPAVYVRLWDRNGSFGWGEIWCNWPSCGAEHRARLLIEDVSDLIFTRKFQHPRDIASFIAEKTAVKILQTDERGPFQQVISGLDAAAHDLVARRENKPLFDLLSPGASSEITVYASGIHIDDAPSWIPSLRLDGYLSFKCKIGFIPKTDSRKVNDLTAVLEQNENLMLDANQGLTFDEAEQFSSEIETSGIKWFEEPIRVDEPRSVWRRLMQSTKIPLAGGENFTSELTFKEAIKDGFLQIIQPDVAKWGGVSGCFEVAQKARKNGRVYCPHFLGGAIGLHTSAHLLAAVGGEGMLEMDVNENPLREAILGDKLLPQNGRLMLNRAPGIGIEPDINYLVKYLTFQTAVQG